MTICCECPYSMHAYLYVVYVIEAMKKWHVTLLLQGSNFVGIFIYRVKSEFVLPVNSFEGEI